MIGRKSHWPDTKYHYRAQLFWNGHTYILDLWYYIRLPIAENPNTCQWLKYNREQFFWLKKFRGNQSRASSLAPRNAIGTWTSTTLLSTSIFMFMKLLFLYHILCSHVRKKKTMKGKSKYWKICPLFMRKSIVFCKLQPMEHFLYWSELDHKATDNLQRSLESKMWRWVSCKPKQNKDFLC